MFPLPLAGDDLTHAVWMGLGICAALGWFAAEVRRRRLADDRLWVIAGMAVAFGAIGARLLTWPQQLDLTQNASLLQWWEQGNRSIIAGLVGAWIGVEFAKRITGYRTSTGDLFAPAVALALVFGRVGCLLTELPGRPTGGEWGIVLTEQQVAVVGGVAGVGLHPSYAYEILFHAVAFAVLWRFRDAPTRPGELFIGYVAAYALFRFGVEFVRAQEPVWWGLTRAQWFLALTLPLLSRRIWRLVHTAWQRRRSATLRAHLERTPA
ncbi:MAG: prolipoprotein diacylglyceryl transferase family protein [Micropruina sp.]